MKRMVSWLLIFSIVFVSCIALSSCANDSAKDYIEDDETEPRENEENYKDDESSKDQVSDKDDGSESNDDGEDDNDDGSSTPPDTFEEPEKNEYEAELDMLGKALDDFFGLDDKSGSILSSFVNGGSVELVFESSMLLGRLTKISKTTYMSSKDNELVSDTLVTYNKKDFGSRALVDKNYLSSDGSAFPGKDKTVALNAITPFNVPELFERSVSEEKIDGVDCIVVSYTVDNKMLESGETELSDVFPQSGRIYPGRASGF